MPADLTLLTILPELILAIGALVLLMVGVFGGDRSMPVVTALSIALIAASFVALLTIPQNGSVFDGAFVVDPFARLLKAVVLIGSGVAIVMSVGYVRLHKFERFEYPILVVIATLGMLLMISANDLIAVYLGLELQSLSLYVVAAINRDSLKSTEAGLKYFVLGALSSGMLLYGMSLVYGFTGQTSFAGIAAALGSGAPSLGLIFGLVFVISGFAFKVSAVPFHMWTPDVYEGAPTPVTAFRRSPQGGRDGLFVRAWSARLPPLRRMAAGGRLHFHRLDAARGVCGDRPANIKRLMAYSSIGHVGFALVALPPARRRAFRA